MEKSFNLVNSVSTGNGGMLQGKIIVTATADVLNNRSEVTVQLYVRKYSPYNNISAYTTGMWYWEMDIDGAEYGREKTGVLDVSTEYILIHQESIQIGHEADGSKSISVRGLVRAPDGTSYSGFVTEGTATIQLETIPRASAVTCDRVKIGEHPTITVNSASPMFTHRLSVKIGDQEEQELQYTPDYVWPASFYALIPNSPYIEGIIYCKTYHGDAQIGETQCCPFYADVDEEISKPTVTVQIEDIDASAAELGRGSLIRYVSDVRFAIDAVPRNGASITAYKAKCGGAILQSSTGVFANIEGALFEFEVTDSRGFKTAVSVEKNIIGYVPLTCNIDSVNITGNGTATVKCSGACYTGRFPETDNSISGTVSWEGGSVALAVVCRENAYEATAEIEGLDYQSSYIFTVEMADRYTQKAGCPVTESSEAYKCVPVFDWSNEDFNFNVPVKMPMLTIGTTTITEAQLQEILNLIQ